MENYEKTGYLRNDFRIFHLNDMKKWNFPITTTILIKSSSS